MCVNLVENFYFLFSLVIMALAADRKRDRLDQFMDRMDDPDHWRKIPGFEDQPLTREELNILFRIQSGDIADLTVDPCAPMVEFFSSVVSKVPVGITGYERKDKFLPSKSEAKMVKKLVKAIRNGLIKVDNNETKSHNKHIRLYDLWTTIEDINNQRQSSKDEGRLPAPKMPLPGHEESYRPPSEYTSTPEEIQKWKDLQNRAPKSAKKWIPISYSCLRHIPAYPHLLQERFSRCLDLYLCPRIQRTKLQIDPESLLPKLPDPKELGPYPTNCSAQYILPKGIESFLMSNYGNMQESSKQTVQADAALENTSGIETKKSIGSVCYDPTGHWMATFNGINESGTGTGLLCIWDVFTTRLLYTWHIHDTKAAYGVFIAWNPNPDLPILAIASGSTIRLLSLAELVATPRIIQNTKKFLLSSITSQKKKSLSRFVTWRQSYPAKESELDNSTLNTKLIYPASISTAASSMLTAIDISVPYVVFKHVSWHRRGDYLVSVASILPERVLASMGYAEHTQYPAMLQVMIHQCSTAITQAPFSKVDKRCSKAVFHPTKPQLYVSYEKSIRHYNLAEHALLKKLDCNSSMISSFAVHPRTGDHIIACDGVESRAYWFDMDYSSLPYRTLNPHQASNPVTLKQGAFHSKYPLFAICSRSSEGGSVYIYHGMVYDDLLQNPLIVPLKRLQIPKIAKQSHTLEDIAFHPFQPWIVTSLGGSAHAATLFVPTVH